MLATFNAYNALKVVHVLAAITWVGGALSVNILGTRILASRDRASQIAFAFDVEWMGNHVYLPASLTVLLFGILTALRGHYSFTNAWLIVGLAGIVATATTGATYLGPELKRIGQLFEQRGPEDAEAAGRLRRLVAISRIDLVVLAIVVLDMVFKPGFH